MTDRLYPLFSIFAFLGFFLPLIPLPWHLQALNSGTCYFIFWSSLASLNQFVNSIVWAGNAFNPSPIWCEISIRIMMGASVGIPAASLCINRRLYLIASVRASPITSAEKRRAILIDSLICVLFPLMFIALQYVVQGHRYNIYEDIGCYPAVYNTLPAFFISSMWPILIGLVSAVYCILSLKSFARRRVEFSQFLSSHSSMTIGRYFRLMALAMTEIFMTVPLSIFVIWINATATPIGPWISWADTHFAYSRVEQTIASVWRANHILSLGLEFSRWITPVCSLIFFAFFGFAEESKRNYRLAWRWIKKTLHISSRSQKSPLKSTEFRISSPTEFRKVDVSPTVHSFVMHDLKRTDTNTTGLYTAYSGKESVYNPASPLSTSYTLAISSVGEHVESPPPFSKTFRIPLERSQTL